MYLTKRHLSRRAVLRGAGVTLALPLLDAMVPAATALAQTAATPKLRMGFFYLPHGKLTGSRHLELPGPTSIANLHLTLLGMLGIERKTFGDSTGTIAL